MKKCPSARKRFRTRQSSASIVEVSYRAAGDGGYLNRWTSGQAASERRQEDSRDQDRERGTITRSGRGEAYVEKMEPPAQGQKSGGTGCLIAVPFVVGSRGGGYMYFSLTQQATSETEVR
jgi:hypothetical protein